MNTEITDNNNKIGIVLYDDDCAACRNLARRFHPLLSRHGLELLPLQTPEIQGRLAPMGVDPLAEMRLLRPDGVLLGSVDALLEISRHYWWAWPIRQFASIPPITSILRSGYRWFARHRYCLNGQCDIKPLNRLESPSIGNDQIPSPRGGETVRVRGGRLIQLYPTARTQIPMEGRVVTDQCCRQKLDFLPLLIFPISALFFRPHVANWVFMWAMALGLYAGCKWLTYQAALRRITKPAWRRAFGYLFAYPGMNAREFLDCRNIPAHPKPVEWLSGAVKTFIGVVLLFGVTPRLFPLNVLLAGWTGMVGVILILHFGLFYLLVLAWQHAGVKATPLMLSPLRAPSLAEFWGRRWNTGFKELSLQWMFRPLQRRTGALTASLLVFGASGLIHELVISLPARGGYGLPTLYFLFQGAGLIAERTPLARQLRLGRGWRGWLFTVLITAGPVFWLFHPPFIQHVILPMLNVIGATGKIT